MYLRHFDALLDVITLNLSCMSLNVALWFVTLKLATKSLNL